MMLIPIQPILKVICKNWHYQDKNINSYGSGQWWWQYYRTCWQRLSKWNDDFASLFKDKDGFDDEL